MTDLFIDTKILFEIWNLVNTTFKKLLIIETDSSKILYFGPTQSVSWDTVAVIKNLIESKVYG